MTPAPPLNAPSGRKPYGIRSSRDTNHVYFVTQSSCDCEDTKRHPNLVCKHRIAVLIHCARMAGKPMPASDTIDGLAQMVVDRHPVLDMVRHPDGEITWERYEHANGTTTYLPRHDRPRPVADASTYERIFGRM